MRKFYIFAFALLLCSGFASAFDSSDVSIPVKKDCYASSTLNPLVYPASKACSQVVSADIWASAAIASTITFNLTGGIRLITGIHLVCAPENGAPTSPNRIATSTDNWKTTTTVYVEITSTSRCSSTHAFYNFSANFASSFRLYYDSTAIAELHSAEARGPKNDSPNAQIAPLSATFWVLLLFFVFLVLLAIAFIILGKGIIGVLLFIIAGLDGIFFAITAFNETGGNLAVGTIGFAMAVFMFVIALMTRVKGGEG